MINKKATLNIGLVFAIFLFLVLAIIFFGGAGKIWEITTVLTKIPTWVYILIGIAFLLKLLSSK